ncbi:unnamed protein product [Cylindrotheca closterium]|uniref:Uncharacterized protein n=1 Tax=Cylindrotheca closterium TaxID=2856 RepID=A0AAD2FCZ9_9STRA|nr:unnamed protein product [Cylindrotheca closterium]
MTEMGSQSAVEDELERILRASGIESSPVDPSSMEFLRQLVVQKKKKKKKKIPTTERRTQLKESPAGQQEGEERNGKPAAAYASNTAADNASHNNSDSNSNNNNNTTSSGALSNSDATMIVEQLKMQTNLILSLQDKIQVLTAKVDDMELRASEDTTTSTTTATRTREQQDASGRVRIIRRDAHPIPPPRDAEAPRRANGIFGNRPVAAAAAVPAAAGPQELQPNVFAWFFETTRLFWVLSRDYVRPIDGALLFKLVFMTTVVMARVSKNSNKNSSKNNKDPKILLVSALLMLGFLFHTRYIQYVYQFLWKQNVPGRVWKGEVNITIPPPDQDDHQDNWNNNNNNNNNNNERENNQPRGPNPVPPRFRRPNQRAQGEAQPAAARRWWQQNDLLVGGVAPIENEHGDAPAAVNPAVAMVQGMYYLVGSFVFSIFPMWNPQGHRQRRPLREERLDADAAADVGGGGGGDNNHNANNGNNDDDPRMIPQVQAPRDAMEAADDSDDDSEGEQN